MARKRRKTTGRTDPKLRQMRIIVLIIIIVCAYALKSYSEHSSSHGSHSQSSSLPHTFGDSLLSVRTNPDLASVPLRYKGMDLSFNPQKHIPNWVAWELTADETSGTVKRASKFVVDAEVAGCADPADYTNSGYDRGHMAPAGDMKWSPEAMSHTFYMTNICPQHKALNTGVWKSLEEKCRTWATAEDTIYIVCGPVLTDPTTETIGLTGVAVPKRFFKVIIAPYACPPRGIGFIMNNGKVKGGMQSAATSIDEVERITGHDFFSALPDSIENMIEAQNDFNYWNTVR